MQNGHLTGKTFRVEEDWRRRPPPWTPLFSEATAQRLRVRKRESQVECPESPSLFLVLRYRWFEGRQPSSSNHKSSPRSYVNEPTSIRWVSCPLVPASSTREDSCTGHETPDSLETLVGSPSLFRRRRRLNYKPSFTVLPSLLGHTVELTPIRPTPLL